MIPVRVPGFGLPATAYVTSPSPVPDAPATMLIQLLVLTAVQWQPLLVATLTRAVAAPKPCDRSVGVRSYEQPPSAESTQPTPARKTSAVASLDRIDFCKPIDLLRYPVHEQLFRPWVSS